MNASDPLPFSPDHRPGNGLPARGLLITGTDTDVGKTFVSVGLLRALRQRGLRVGGYKPVCSGVLTEAPQRWHDIEALWSALDGEFPRERIGPQCFDAAVAPPVAATREGRAVDRELLVTGARWWTDHVDALLIEGAGGLLCPITQEETLADIAVDFGYPLLIVARASLGTVNHTLLTIEVARTRGLAIQGVVLNMPAGPVDREFAAENAEEISRRGNVPLPAIVPFNDTRFSFQAISETLGRVSGSEA